MHQREAKHAGKRDAPAHAAIDDARRRLLERPRRHVHQCKGARHAGERSQEQPSRHAVRIAHGERRQRDGEERTADGRLRACRTHRQERAGEIAEVVGRGEIAALRERDAGVVLHHRQEGREGEAADTHGHDQGGETGERHADAIHAPL